MRPIYQVTGAKRGQNGDCFQACLATLLGKTINQVPNFYETLSNGETVPAAVSEMMASWLHGAGCGGYVEFGFPPTLGELLKNVGSQSPGSYFLITGVNTWGNVHTVVCCGDRVWHDPSTSVGHTLVKPCEDGYYRVGFLLHRTG